MKSLEENELEILIKEFRVAYWGRYGHIPIIIGGDAYESTAI